MMAGVSRSSSTVIWSRRASFFFFSRAIWIMSGTAPADSARTASSRSCCSWRSMEMRVWIAPPPSVSDSKPVSSFIRRRPRDGPFVYIAKPCPVREAQDSIFLRLERGQVVAPAAHRAPVQAQEVERPAHRLVDQILHAGGADIEGRQRWGDRRAHLGKLRHGAQV